MHILLSPGSSRSCGFFARMFPISQGFPILMYLHASVCSSVCWSSNCSRPHLNQSPTYVLCFNPSCGLPRKVSYTFSLTSRVVLGKDQVGLTVWDEDARTSSTLVSSRSGNVGAPQDFSSSHAAPTYALAIPLEVWPSAGHQLPILGGRRTIHPWNFPLSSPLVPAQLQMTFKHCFPTQSSYFQPILPCSSGYGHPHTHISCSQLPTVKTSDIKQINQKAN